MTPRGIASRAYQRLAAPFGRRALERMIADGLPHRLIAPLRFLFDGREPAEAAEAAERIERVRAKLAVRGGTFTLPPTSASHPRVLTWSWLANHVSVQRRWGIFLHLCARGSRNVLELGSCVGISGAYLGTAGPYVVSIEASPELAPVARDTIARLSRGEVLHGMFYDRLPEALQRLFDLAYVDGHHDGAATIRYVQMIAPYLERGALIILDDIRLYDEMVDAWRALQTMPGIAASVDAGRFGILVWGEGDGKSYDLSRYTGVRAKPRPRPSG